MSGSGSRWTATSMKARGTARRPGQARAASSHAEDARAAMTARASPAASSASSGYGPDPDAAGGTAPGDGQQRAPPPAVRQDLMGAGRAGAAGRLAVVGAAGEHAGADPGAGDQARGGSGEDPGKSHHASPPRPGCAPMRWPQPGPAGGSASLMLLKLEIRTQSTLSASSTICRVILSTALTRARAIGRCGEIDHELAQPLCARERGQARDDQLGHVAGVFQRDPGLGRRLTRKRPARTRRTAAPRMRLRQLQRPLESLPPRRPAPGRCRLSVCWLSRPPRVIPRAWRWASRADRPARCPRTSRRSSHP